MKVPTSDRSGSIEPNLTSMIDVVFLLIIFFLVSSHLARQELQVELDLPQAASGVDPQDSSTPRVTINVLPDGRTLLSGEAVRPQQLGPLLRAESAKHDGHLEVRIRGDRTVAYRHIAPILRSCAEASVWDVKFAVLEKRN